MPKPPISTVAKIIVMDENGNLRWLWRDPNSSPRAKQFNARFAGKEAFTAINSKGYRTGAVCGFPVNAHVVVWALTHGRWPKDGWQIDHINHDPTDNRPENLREVPRILNQRNMRMYRSNSTGVAGVSYDRKNKVFQARVGRACVARVKTLEAAAAALSEARAKMGYHHNHGS